MAAQTRGGPPSWDGLPQCACLCFAGEVSTSCQVTPSGGPREPPHHPPRAWKPFVSTATRSRAKPSIISRFNRRVSWLWLRVRCEARTLSGSGAALDGGYAEGRVSQHDPTLVCMAPCPRPHNRAAAAFCIDQRIQGASCPSPELHQRVLSVLVDLCSFRPLTKKRLKGIRASFHAF